MYLIDTSALIELLKPTELGAAILLEIGDSPVAISSVTRFEYLLYYSGKKLEEEKNVLRNLPVLDLTSDAADKSVDIEKLLRSKGKLINETDILIASICMVNNFSLVTLDKHFSNIPGLVIKKFSPDPDPRENRLEEDEPETAVDEPSDADDAEPEEMNEPEKEAEE